MAVRRVLVMLAVALAALVALALLRVLSNTLTARHLQNEAAQMAARVRAGDPLWRWRLRVPDDLIAGRAFGPARLAPGDAGLRITATAASPYELGLPIEHALDLVHWPWLRVTGRADAPIVIDLLRATAGARCAARAATLPAGVIRVRLDLRALAWSGSAGCARLSPTELLRLRIAQPAAGTLALDDIALLPRADLPMPSASPMPLADVRTDAAHAGVAPAMPWVALPAGATSETWLAARDRLQTALPAALVTVAGDALAVNANAARGLDVLACVVIVAALALLAAFGRRLRTLAWVELAVMLAGLLWLIAGLRWGSDYPGPAAIAFAATVVYAWLRRRAVSASWRWFDPAPGSWWPLALLPVAGALAWLAGHAPAWPAPRAALTYLLWAAMQQWLMLAVLLPRLRTLLASDVAAVLATALAFALLHTPNGALMQLCLLAELCWAGWFLRRPVLAPVALAHAACAVVMQASLDGGWLRSLEVGARFFR